MVWYLHGRVSVVHGMVSAWYGICVLVLRSALPMPVTRQRTNTHGICILLLCVGRATPLLPI